MERKSVSKMSSFSYPSSSHVKPRRSRVDHLFEGTISPSEKAYLDIFVMNNGVDRNLVALSNVPSTSVGETKEPNQEAQIHKLFYNGEEVWRADPNQVDFAMADVSDEESLSQNISSKRHYKSTCVLMQDPQQLDFTIESILSPVASDQEVQDEIAAAPTSVWCNTSNGCHDALSSTTPTMGTGLLIFRESRKISVESLIRASAEAHQRLFLSVPEREAKVFEYCVGGAREDNVPDVEASDGSDDGEETYSCQDKTMSGNRDMDVDGVVKSSVSMASDSSSVYLNQEDDELSAQQQEMVRAFGGVGCFVNVA
jgi:hypothetical protein